MDFTRICDEDLDNLIEWLDLGATALNALMMLAPGFLISSTGTNCNTILTELKAERSRRLAEMMAEENCPNRDTRRNARRLAK